MLHRPEGGYEMKSGVCAFSVVSRWMLAAVLPLPVGGVAQAEIASIYGGRDGLCGHRTANGERLDCAAMTAAHRTLPFGAHIVVCHKSTGRSR